MEIIKFDDFAKLEIRIGKILSAEKVENSNKLLKLEVDFGDEKRQIIAGLAKFYASEDLVGKECPFAFNLEPKSLGGLESQGMILCPSNETGPVLLHPDKPVLPGAKIK
jgi:methionine--tRNA ligase beta chain